MQQGQWWYCEIQVTYVVEHKEDYVSEYSNIRIHYPKPANETQNDSTKIMLSTGYCSYV